MLRKRVKNKDEEEAREKEVGRRKKSKIDKKEEMKIRRRVK